MSQNSYNSIIHQHLYEGRVFNGLPIELRFIPRNRTSVESKIENRLRFIKLFAKFYRPYWSYN